MLLVIRTIVTFLILVYMFPVNKCFSENIKTEIKPIRQQSTSTIVQKRYFESIDATELKLSNGLTICLKSTDSDTDEIFFKLIALGGYGSLNPKKFYSGQLADKIAWESGMGGMTSDQISVFLYKNALEFVLEISPFCRKIDGEGGEESVNSFLKGLNLVFTQQLFTQEGFHAAKVLEKDIISKLNNDNEHAFETMFLKVNTQNFPALRPMAIEDLDKVKFDEAKSFFQRCFLHPNDFFLVISGNFNIEKTIANVEKYIGSIPRPESNSKLKRAFNVPFPPGITQTTFKLPTQSSCLTHITFPLKIEVNEQNIDEIAFMCQIIEAHLRQAIIQKMNLSYGVDVSYEFPIFPFLNNPWISIRFRCEEKFIISLKEMILAELKRLQLNGTTQSEIEIIRKLEKNSQEFWFKDDFYWVSMISNYYLWGWNPEKIADKSQSIYKIDLKTINIMLKKAFSLTNYSVITAIGNP
jgi:predicted Zn-dependent peptidase